MKNPKESVVDSQESSFIVCSLIKIITFKILSRQYNSHNRAKIKTRSFTKNDTHVVTARGVSKDWLSLFNTSVCSGEADKRILKYAHFCRTSISCRSDGPALPFLSLTDLINAINHLLYLHFYLKYFCNQISSHFLLNELLNVKFKISFKKI